MTLDHKMCDYFANTGMLNCHKASHTKTPVEQLLGKLPVFSLLAGARSRQGGTRHGGAGETGGGIQGGAGGSKGQRGVQGGEVQGVGGVQGGWGRRRGRGPKEKGGVQRKVRRRAVLLCHKRLGPN